MQSTCKIATALVIPLCGLLCGSRILHRYSFSGQKASKSFLNSLLAKQKKRDCPLFL
jgi:hypothetical protein